MNAKKLKSLVGNTLVLQVGLHYITSSSIAARDNILLHILMF